VSVRKSGRQFRYSPLATSAKVVLTETKRMNCDNIGGENLMVCETIGW
jgi:hypothetical protein